MAKARARTGSRTAAASRAERVVAALAQVFPGATTELAYRNAFELLVATILSAQSTDARVNSVTPALFAKYPGPQALAAADLTVLEQEIKATGFFRMKSRAIVNMAAVLLEEHGGEVPRSMDALVRLPGVGRKTANVVLGHAFGVPGLPVDRHVQRVATRVGLARGTTAEAIEAELCAQLPPRVWTLASDCLILHGRRVCRPRPLCEKCVVRTECEYYRACGSGNVNEPRATSHRPRRAPPGPPAVPPSVPAEPPVVRPTRRRRS